MMAPSTPRLRILSVGGNAVSAFLSWRLQATNACDVTLVWKSGFDSVAQYGISFKSRQYGNERFKPYQVVRSPEDASQISKAPFDYVLLCVKALPDVYDLAAVIESVVSPQHTCILINTTHSLGIESYLEQRFPTNVVLSLVSGADIVQLGASEFEHRGATDIWVGPANKNPSIPVQIQSDMAEALAMTLSSGDVDCKVSTNIRQQQYERMIGPIAFHPTSVLFETPNHAELLDKVGVRSLITATIDELLRIAKAQGCHFADNFRETTMESMIAPTETNSIMYQDFTAKRPMEVETYLGSAMKLAQEVGMPTPRIETLYAMLHHLNIINQQRPAISTQSPTHPGPPPRLSSMPMPGPRGPPMNGNGPMKGPMRPGSRAQSMNGPNPMMPRGPPRMNGYGRGMANGQGPYPSAPNMSKRPSFEGDDLGEFSHVVMYDNAPEGGFNEGSSGMYPDGNMTSSSSDFALRERELALRQKELALREQEYRMRQQPGPRRGPPPPASHAGGFDDDDEDDDYFDPMAGRSNQPQIDPDNFDMMSVTSRRNRKQPTSNMRQGHDMGMMPPPGMGRGSRNPFARPKQNRSSASLMANMPQLHDNIMSNPLLSYSSDRYGSVDRERLGQESRTNSLTAERLNELSSGGGGPGYNGGYPTMTRRSSQSPGNPLSPGPGPRPGGRPSPPNGYAPNGMAPNGMPLHGMPPNGMHPNGMHPNGMQPNGMQSNGMHPNGMQNGRPSPPGMRQPVPRHPPGHGNAVAPHQIEQHTGVSNLYPPKKNPQVRSLTGSASASAESGDSGASAHLDSEPSAHSSSSSLGPRPPIRAR